MEFFSFFLLFPFVSVEMQAKVEGKSKQTGEEPCFFFVVVFFGLDPFAFVGLNKFNAEYCSNNILSILYSGFKYLKTTS